MKDENERLKLKVRHYAEACEAEQYRQKSKISQNNLTTGSKTQQIETELLHTSLSQVKTTFKGVSDFARVEKLGRHVKQMMTAKKPVDCILAIFQSCKEAFKNLLRSSVFIIDHQLISQLESGKYSAIQARLLKKVSCEGIQSGYVIAITDQDTDFFTASFRSIEEAKILVFNQSICRVPFFSNTGTLLCVF